MLYTSNIVYLASLLEKYEDEPLVILFILLQLLRWLFTYLPYVLISPLKRVVTARFPSLLSEKSRVSFFRKFRQLLYFIAGIISYPPLVV
jgi:hypothetical protein